MKNLPSESRLSLGWPVNISASLELGCFFRVLSVVVYSSPPTFSSTMGDSCGWHKGTKTPHVLPLSGCQHGRVREKGKKENTIAAGNWNGSIKSRMNPCPEGDRWECPHHLFLNIGYLCLVHITRAAETWTFLNGLVLTTSLGHSRVILPVGKTDKKSLWEAVSGLGV